MEGGDKLPRAAEAVASVIFNHRSIRRYRKEGIPEEHVRLLIEAARRAPTDGSLHLWTAIRVKNPALRRKIADLIGQEHVGEAPEFFIFIADLYRPTRLVEHIGGSPAPSGVALFMFAAVDAALAAENMAILAESLGYGICFIGGIQSAAKEIIEMLRLPENTYPLFGLTVGVPAEDPPRRPRLPGDLLVHVDGYRDYTPEDLDRALKEMRPISARGWERILLRYLGERGVFEYRNPYVEGLLRRQGILGRARD
ncbi:MAG: nitroreductase family protein [Desulfurococcales archaeon]|nr:nitroreductase family protein [Desulfurococcales archaeon]